MANQEIAAIRRALESSGGFGTTLEEMRKGFDAFGLNFPTAADIELTPATIDGVPVEWSFDPHCERSGAIIYLHGGGYLVGSIKSHRHMVTELGRAAGVPLVAVDYRLAPEHPFPAALDDAMAVYRHLLDLGLDAKSIAIAGDSAGGGLAVGLALAVRDAGLPQPGCLVGLSPWVDLGVTGGTMDTKAAEDPLVPKGFLLELAAAYLGGEDYKHPHASPIYGDFRDIAPLLILMGSTETLIDDGLRLAGAAGAAEVHVRFEIWPEMLHVWPLYHPVLREGKTALKLVGDYIREHLVATSNPPKLV